MEARLLGRRQELAWPCRWLGDWGLAIRRELGRRWTQERSDEVCFLKPVLAAVRTLAQGQSRGSIRQLPAGGLLQRRRGCISQSPVPPGPCWSCCLPFPHPGNQAEKHQCRENEPIFGVGQCNLPCLKLGLLMGISAPLPGCATLDRSLPLQRRSSAGKMKGGGWCVDGLGV